MTSENVPSTSLLTFFLMLKQIFLQHKPDNFQTGEKKNQLSFKHLNRQCLDTKRTCKTLDVSRPYFLIKSISKYDILIRKLIISVLREGETTEEAEFMRFNSQKHHLTYPDNN